MIIITVNKEELFKKMDGLSDEQLQLVKDYVEQLSKNGVIDTEALKYVTENYDETLKGLAKR